MRYTDCKVCAAAVLRSNALMPTLAHQSTRDLLVRYAQIRALDTEKDALKADKRTLQVEKLELLQQLIEAEARQGTIEQVCQSDGLLQRVHPLH
jgi:hypothetical protein